MKKRLDNPVIAGTDANVFIHALSGNSKECRELLRRCSTEEVLGITILDVINEVTHRLMLAEAVAKNVILKSNVSALKEDIFDADHGLSSRSQNVTLKNLTLRRLIET